MQKKNFFSQMWDLFGPLLLQAAVGIGVSMAANTVLLMRNLDIYMKVIQSGSQQALMEFINKQADELISYAGQITIATALCTIPVMLLLLWRDEKKRKRNGVKKVEKAPWRAYLPVIPFAAAAGVGINNLLLLINLSSVSASYTQTSDELYNISFVGQLIGYGLITPICEELMFRALIYRRLREGQKTFYRAMIVSALMFGLYHGNLIQFCYGTALGLLFAYLYEKYHSLAAPVLAHMIVNLAAVVLTKVDVFTWMFQKPVRMGIITVICAAAGSALFVVISGVSATRGTDPRMS